MIERRPRWGLWLAGFSLLLIGAIQLGRHRTEVAAGRQIFLREGRVQVVRVEDPITLIVRPLDPPASQYSSTYRVRLFGLEARTRPGDAAHDAARRWTEGWVAGCRNREVELIYDHQRFDDSETPIAFVFHQTECLNIRLLQMGLARLVRYSGMPSRWSREMIKATAQAPEIVAR
jgi:hypothetical protein